MDRKTSPINSASGRYLLMGIVMCITSVPIRHGMPVFSEELTGCVLEEAAISALLQNLDWDNQAVELRNWTCVDPAWICAALYVRPVDAGFHDLAGIGVSKGVVAINIDSTRVSCVRINGRADDVIGRFFRLGTGLCGIVVLSARGGERLISWNLTTGVAAEREMPISFASLCEVLDWRHLATELQFTGLAEVDNVLSVVDLSSKRKARIPMPARDYARIPENHRAVFPAARRWYAPFAEGKGILVFDGAASYVESVATHFDPRNLSHKKSKPG